MVISGKTDRVHSTDFCSYLNRFLIFRNRNEKQSKQNENGTTIDPIPADFGSKSMSEYLLGSRKMKSFPVAMSLVAR